MRPENPRRPDRAVVIGAGIAGLTAAFRLSQAGTQVTVVEPDRVGGKLQTSLVAGRPIDEGADAFLLRVPWALALCHDLDIDGELVSPVVRTAEIFVDGRRHPMPTGHVMGVPTDLDALAHTGLLSAAGLDRVRADLDRPADPADPGPGRADVAIGPYLRRRFGAELVDRLLDPLVGGINAGDIDRLSLAAVVPQLDAAARSGDASLIRSCTEMLARAEAASGLGPGQEPPPVFATPIGGMARLVDALVALMPGTELRLGRRVHAVHPGPSQTTVTLDDGTAIETDAVVVACPAFAAAGLLNEVAPRAAAHLADIEYASVTMTTLAFARDSVRSPLEASGCLIPRGQGHLATAVSYGTSKWAQWRDPNRDDVILRTSAGRVGDDRHLELDDSDLVAALLDDLDAVVGLSGAPVDARVTRWSRSLPQYAPGHLDRMHAVEEELAERTGRRVAVAGAALGGVGVPACIRSGEEAATTLGATWPTRRQLKPR